MEQPKKLIFEYMEREMLDGKKIKLVALNAHLKDFDGQVGIKDGEPILIKPAMSVKDCRNIDGCVYFALGQVPDVVLVDYIEKFQKLLKEDGWKFTPTNTNFLMV